MKIYALLTDGELIGVYSSDTKAHAAKRRFHDSYREYVAYQIRTIELDGAAAIHE